MPVNYTFQSSATLTEIAPELIVTATMDDPVFDILPITPIRSSRLRWKIRDNYKGLMNSRGLGGEPTRVNKLGFKIYETNPAAFGEVYDIDEIEMTNRAAGIANSDISIPVDVRDLVSEGQEFLSIRQASRMRQMSWLLLTAGTISVNNPDGSVGWTDSYTQQALTVSPLWSSLSTAHPIADLRSLQPTYGFGTSGHFTSQAKMYMNTATLNYLLNNQNANDLFGRRLDFGQTVNDLPSLNNFLLATADLPRIVIHDDGYIDDSGTFHLFIPTGTVVVVGYRPNDEKPGAFQLTRNANNPNYESAPYAFVDDRTQGPTKTVPPRIDVHQGFNGGTVLERASQIVVLTVA